MMQTLKVGVALLALTSLAQAQTTFTSFRLSPETQELQSSLWVNTGFPDGQVLTSLAFRCGAGERPQVHGLSELAMDQWGPDAAKTAAVTKSGAIQVGANAVTVKSVGGDLRLVCQNKVLKVDFSKIAAKLDGAVKIMGSESVFDLRQDAILDLLTVRFPLTSRREASGYIVPQSVTVRLAGRTGWAGPKALADVQASNWDDLPHGAVFLYDAKANVLLPIRFGGQSGMAKLRGRPVGEMLTLYGTPDHRAATGWTRLTVDFKAGLIWGQPASRPSGATFGN